MIAQIEEPKKCCVDGCEEMRSDYGKGRRCIMHGRAYQMMHSAKERGLRVPTDKDLEVLFLSVKDMICKHCGVKMEWRSDADGKRGKVVSLQHNQDGTLDLICHTCNVIDGNVKHGMAFSMPEGKHVCSQCGEMKDVEAFNKSKNTAKGHDNACKTCRANWLKEYREANRAHVRKSNKLWVEKNPGKIAKYNERRRSKRAANPEKHSEQARLRYAASPEKYREYERHRYAAKKAAKKASLQGDTHPSGTFIEKQLAGG